MTTYNNWHFGNGPSVKHLPPTRHLCYRHHCQEFDKLSNITRYHAAYWQTVDAADCELCHTVAV